MKKSAITESAGSSRRVLFPFGAHFFRFSNKKSQKSAIWLIFSLNSEFNRQERLPFDAKFTHKTVAKKPHSYL